MNPWILGGGLIALAVISLLLLVLIPNRGIRTPTANAPRTDRGLLRNVIGQI